MKQHEFQYPQVRELTRAETHTFQYPSVKEIPRDTAPVTVDDMTTRSQAEYHGNIYPFPNPATVHALGELARKQIAEREAESAAHTTQHN